MRNLALILALASTLPAAGKPLYCYGRDGGLICVARFSELRDAGATVQLSAFAEHGKRADARIDITLPQSMGGGSYTCAATGEQLPIYYALLAQPDPLIGVHMIPSDSSCLALQAMVTVPQLGSPARAATPPAKMPQLRELMKQRVPLEKPLRKKP